MKDKYKKEKFEPLVKKSKSYSEILIGLGMSTHGNSRTTIKKYVKLYDIDISHFETNKEKMIRINKKLGKLKRRPLSEIMVENSTYTSTNHLKNRLYDEGIKKRICEKCGQDEWWEGERMSLILDHINGVHNDHRLENLRILCPNCNATLPTHGGKNIKN